MPTVLQLSDTHLLPSGEKLYGRDVNVNFLNVVAAVRSSTPFDLVILTGDISEKGTKESCRRIGRATDAVVPGNNGTVGKDTANVCDKSDCLRKKLCPRRIGVALRVNR